MPGSAGSDWLQSVHRHRAVEIAAVNGHVPVDGTALESLLAAHPGLFRARTGHHALCEIHLECVETDDVLGHLRCHFVAGCCDLDRVCALVVEIVRRVAECCQHSRCH